MCRRAELLKAAGYAIADGASDYDAITARITRTVANWTPEQRRWLLDLMDRTDAVWRDDESA